MAQARADFCKDKIRNINGAGDWKASAYLLERHPDTREDFAPAIGGRGGSIQITVNMPSPQPVDMGKVVDITASEIGDGD